MNSSPPIASQGGEVLHVTHTISMVDRAEFIPRHIESHEIDRLEDNPDWFWSPPRFVSMVKSDYKGRRYEYPSLRAPDPPQRGGHNRAEYDAAIEHRNQWLEFQDTLREPDEIECFAGPEFGGWNPADAIECQSACDCGWTGEAEADDCPRCGDPFWIKKELSARIARGERRSWSANGNRWRV